MKKTKNKFVLISILFTFALHFWRNEQFFLNHWRGGWVAETNSLL